MSYLFPKRALRAGDVLDPTELTEDIAPAAERVSGRLNAHNISQTVQPTITVDDEAYYKISHYAQAAGFRWYDDPSSTPGSLWVPDWGNSTLGGWDPTPAASAVLNNFEWQTLDSTTYGTVRVSVSTGNSVLWVNAYAQYLWFGFDPTAGVYGTTRWYTSYPSPSSPGQHKNRAMEQPCGLQFAIRVDGNIIPETITGVDDTIYRASIPLKPTTQRTDTILLAPGPADARGEQICALGPPCLPIRVGACVPVSSGDHTIELVVRRVPFVGTTNRGSSTGTTVSYGPYDNIYVFARQLNVIELKAYPVDSATAFEVTAPSFSEEETLSTASLYTDRVQPVITAYNAVEAGGLQRGALMHEHLPSALLSAATTEREYGTGPVFNNWIPSTELLDTVTLTGYAGTPGVGWKLIDDSGADPISITSFGAQQVCKVLVLVNMQVRNIGGNVALGVSGEPGQVTGANDDRSSPRFGDIKDFALFKIMWQRVTDSSTDWTGVNESIGMVNNFVWWPKTPSSGSASLETPPNSAYSLEHVEVQLMALLDFDTASLSNVINIGVFGGVANDGCEYQVGRGNIIALKLRSP